MPRSTLTRSSARRSGGGGGVQQIIAGAGVAVSPVSGTGIVTVSASGGTLTIAENQIGFGDSLGNLVGDDVWTFDPSTNIVSLTDGDPVIESREDGSGGLSATGTLRAIHNASGDIEMRAYGPSGVYPDGVGVFANGGFGVIESTSSWLFNTGGANRRLNITGTGDIIPGDGSSPLVVGATEGWLWGTAIAGPPVGVPSESLSSARPMGIDVANNDLYWFTTATWTKAVKSAATQVTVGQIPFATANNTLGGSANFLWVAANSAVEIGGGGGSTSIFSFSVQRTSAAGTVGQRLGNLANDGSSLYRIAAGSSTTTSAAITQLQAFGPTATGTTFGLSQAGSVAWNALSGSGTPLNYAFFQSQITTSSMVFGIGTTNYSLVLAPNQNVVQGKGSAIATSATDGFQYIASSAGAPAGTPTAFTGSTPITIDNTNDDFYFRNGANAAWIKLAKSTSVALPVGQVGFGNPTSDGITSSANLLWDTTNNGLNIGGTGSGTSALYRFAVRQSRAAGDLGINIHNQATDGNALIQLLAGTSTSSTAAYLLIRANSPSSTNTIFGISDASSTSFVSSGVSGSNLVSTFFSSATGTMYFGIGSNYALRIAANGNVIQGNGSTLATSATDGFMYTRATAGVPAGTPTAFTGSIPITVDSTNDNVYFRNGANAAWIRLAKSTDITNYTFSTGLTNSAGTITANLSVGSGSSQTVIGATSAFGSLRLQSTTDSSRGHIYFGTGLWSRFDEGAEGNTSITTPILVVGGSASATQITALFRSNGTTRGGLRATSSGGFNVFSTAADLDFYTGGDSGTGTLVARASVTNFNWLIGTTSDDAASKFKVVASKTVASASGAVWDGIKYGASTLTLTGTTTVTEIGFERIERPTITDGSAVTVTNAATVIIDGEPIAGGSVSIGTGATNAKALWIKRGFFQHGGNYSIGASGTVAEVYGDTSSGILSSPNATTRFTWNNTGIGFYTTAPIAKPAASGSRGGNAALASLLTALSNLGLVTDSTSA